MNSCLPRLLATAALAAALVSSSAAQIRLYSLTDLGAYGVKATDWNASSATAINNNGEVVGSVWQGPDSMLARFGGGTVTPYPSIERPPTSWGSAINNRGTLVGWAEAGYLTSVRAFIVDAAGVRSDFGVHMDESTELTKINDWDEFIGDSGITLGGTHSFLGHPSGWSRNITDEAGSGFRAEDLNNGWEIAGNGRFGPMIYNHLLRSSTYLDSVLGSSSRVTAINDAVEVAGIAAQRGFIYHSGSVVYFGSDVREVTDMNNAGDVVGSDAEAGHFVYLRSRGTLLHLGDVLDLGARGWTLTSVTGINDRGVICGTAKRLPRPGEATLSDGYVYRAVKLTPYELPLIAPF